MAKAENSLSVFESRYNQEKNEKEIIKEALIKSEQEVRSFLKMYFEEWRKTRQKIFAAKNLL